MPSLTTPFRPPVPAAPRSTSSSSAAAATSGCPWPSPSPTAACDRRRLRHQRGRRQAPSRRRAALPRGWRRPTCSTEAWPTGRFAPAPTRRSSRGAETVIVVIGTPVDEHLNPDPQAIPRALRRSCRQHLRDGQLLVLRSTVYPGVTALVERLVAEPGPRRRRRLLPRAHRRGQGDDRAVHACRRSSPARTARPCERAAQALRPPHRPGRPARARGGRAGQAVHQHLALHQVRHRQPVLHDGQRPRPRLRAHPAGARRTTTPAPPTCRAPGSRPGRACSRTRCSWPRSTTTTSRSATRRCWSTRACRSTWSSSWSSATTCRSMTVGILGMAFKAESDDTRSSLTYKLKRILRVQGRRRARAPTPTSPSTPTLRPARARCWPSATCSSSAAPHARLRRPRDRPAGRRRLEPVRARGASTCDASRVSVVIPAYNEGDGIVPVLDRIFESRRVRRARSWSSSTSPRTPPSPVSERLRARPSRGCAPLVNTYGRGPANAIRFGIDAAERPVVVVTMADGCDDPRQIDDAGPAGRARRGGGRRLALQPRRPAGRRPGVQGRCSRELAGRSLHRLARVGTRDADQLLQGLLHATSSARSASTAAPASRSASS